MFLGKIAFTVLPLLALLKFVSGNKPPVKGRIIEGEVVEEDSNNNSS